MPNTTVRIVDNTNMPITNAFVLVSDIHNSWVAVNENGEVNYNADENTALASTIAVKLENGEILTGHIIIDAGDTVTLCMKHQEIQ